MFEVHSGNLEDADTNILTDDFNDLINSHPDTNGLLKLIPESRRTTKVIVNPRRTSLTGYDPVRRVATGISRTQPTLTRNKRQNVIRLELPHPFDYSSKMDVNRDKSMWWLLNDMKKLAIEQLHTEGNRYQKYIEPLRRHWLIRDEQRITNGQALSYLPWLLHIPASSGRMDQMEDNLKRYLTMPSHEVLAAYQHDSYKDEYPDFINLLTAIHNDYNPKKKLSLGNRQFIGAARRARV
jgi:hypothetical protein